MEESTRRRETNEVKVMDAAEIGYVSAPAVCWKTQSKVEVSPRVSERGRETKNDDIEEPTQLPIRIRMQMRIG